MPYYYTNYYANVRGYSTVKVDYPAETSSWLDNETVHIGNPAGTPFTYRVSSTLFYDDQPEGTAYSDLSPFSSHTFPRLHPKTAGTNGDAFGTYVYPPDSPGISTTTRDYIPASNQFLVLDTNLTGSVTAGTKIYNTNHEFTTEEAINFSASWRNIPNTFLSACVGTAFASLTSSDQTKLIVYAFGGDKSYVSLASNPIAMPISPTTEVVVCTASTSNGGLKLDISPWFLFDDKQVLWNQGNSAGAFTSSDGSPASAGTAITIPSPVGVSRGAACVDKVTNTVFFGGGIRDLYVGSGDVIFGWNKIFGWNYDPVTGMITGSSFVAGEMPMGRADFEMFIANGFLYCVGGWTGSYDSGTWAESSARVTCSAHSHIHRAFILNDGQLVDWAECSYEIPKGADVLGTGSGVVDGASFIYPDNAASTDKRQIYIVGGLKSFTTASVTEGWRASAQAYTAELNFTGSASRLPKQFRLGIDDEWKGPSQGEVLTVGPSLGPNDIKPVFPLLEDIYQQLVVPTSPDRQLPETKQLVGFRPGLRGTDIYGTWQFRFSTTPGIFNTNGTADTVSWAALTSSQVYIRQLRIEFLVDSTSGYSDIQYFNPARERLYKRTSKGFRSGKNLIDIISGSQWWDAGVSYVYSYQHPEYGRTVGITTNEADDYAVFTRLTGALATALTGTPDWFLNPPAGEGMPGLPYIPLSSASLGEYGQPIGVTGTSADMIAATIDQQLPVPANNTLPAYLSRIRAIRTTQQRFEEQLRAIDTGSYF